MALPVDTGVLVDFERRVTSRIERPLGEEIARSARSIAGDLPDGVDRAPNAIGDL